MAHPTATLALVVALAFCVGFASQRGSVCGLLAARQIVETRRVSRLIAFASAGVWALVVVVPLHWYATGLVALSPSRQVSALTALGGALYGLGTVINGACVFGTASRILSGNLAFLGALPGIALGAATGIQLGLPAYAGKAAATSPLSVPSPLAIAVLAAGAALAAAALVAIVRSHARAGLSLGRILRGGRWRTSLAMMVIGVCGGLLIGLAAPSTYPALLRQLGLLAVGQKATLVATLVLGPLALALGGVTSALLGGRVTRRPVRAAQVARSFAGGAIMALAATFIPGGNDVLLLAALPGLALHGLVAYGAMLATQIILLEAAKRRRAG